ncbi:MAG: nitroreductase family deazaflavin-dependent oxidoreductase [Thermoleophilia bacterium]|jgi:deazaflavin-dependent oxidoreductase (nitroreductase family)|nr:nitroreductase family deazaflavin-dependent oxidoreductase [Thermoleophilia bacterium]
MGEFDEMNRQVIAEFRANGGKVGGFFANADIVLLHSKGAKSGKEYLNPLMAMPVGDDMAIIASMGGAPRNPDWYYNVKANPDVTVEYGTETYRATAVEVTGEERDRIFTAVKTKFSNFAEYEAKTTRTIPVVLLKRAS